MYEGQKTPSSNLLKFLQESPSTSSTTMDFCKPKNPICNNCNLNKNSVNHIYTLNDIYLENKILIKSSKNIKNNLLKNQNLNNNK